MKPYIRQQLESVTKEVAELWTSDTVASLYHDLNTDRENIDVLVDVLAALEAFADHLSEHERAPI